MTNAPTEFADVNERVEADWVEDTTPFDRVHTVMKQTYEPASVSEIATRARTSPKTARKHLRQLVDEGFVEESAAPNGNGMQYRRSSESVVLERANRILSEVDSDTLTERIIEMQNDLREYRDQYGVDSPEDAALEATEIDQDTLQRWQTTRRNLSFAKVALALSEAEQTVQEGRVA